MQKISKFTTVLCKLIKWMMVSALTGCEWSYDNQRSKCYFFLENKQFDMRTSY